MKDQVMKWFPGEPPKYLRGEWFIAQLDTGERVVLRALPEEFSYDYKTADDTYYAASKIKKWMQFPDSQFLPFEPEINKGPEPVSKDDK